jgi:phenylacetate-CoA ligase
LRKRWFDIVKTPSLSSIVALARTRSPFYEKLYAHLPDDPALADLPVVNQTEFWAAHQRDRREILTAPLSDGIAFTSGGTTGAPKFSYLTEEEWKWAIEISVRSFNAGLKDGDRVANLFIAGGLHASFLYATDLIRASQPAVFHLPISYFNALPDTALLIRKLEANVLAGMPTLVMKLVEYLENEGLDNVRFRSIIYAGEAFSEAQIEYLLRLFPGLEIHSGGYASVDAGAIAFADEGCVPGEHRVFDEATILEILDDETGDPIEETGKAGKVIFTNLTRQLMPIIRYPSGDYATWLEPAGTPMRKFRLLGRAEEGARLAVVTIRVVDVRALLEPFRERLGISSFQLLFTTEEGRDGVTLRLVADAPEAELAAATSSILETFESYYPLLVKMIDAGSVRPARLAWIALQDLVVSPRTGKTLTVVDRRRT